MTIFFVDSYGYEIISGTNNVILKSYGGLETIIKDKSDVDYGPTRYSITEIAENAFQSKPITSATFDNVITIGQNAFNSCSLLTTVNFPVATTIGDSAFFECSLLTTLTFPNVVAIGNYSFMNCLSLTSVSFPVATTIGMSAFADCLLLHTITLEKITTIGDFAFFGCQMTNITLSRIQTIGIGSFIGCKLTSIILPSTISSIGNLAFLSCYSLNNVTFDGSIPSISTQYYDMPGFGETKGYCFHIAASTTPIRLQKTPITVHYNPSISNADKLRLVEAFQTLDPPFTPPITLIFTSKPHNSMQTGIGSVRNFRAKYKRS